MGYVEPISLSHHFESEIEQCFNIKGLHFCRRCFVLYPVILAVAIVTFANGINPPVWMIWAGALPATIEHFLLCWNKITYEPKRAILLNIIAGISVGLGVRYLWDDASDLRFWGPALIYGFIWAIGWVKTTVETVRNLEEL